MFVCLAQSIKCTIKKRKSASANQGPLKLIMVNASFALQGWVIWMESANAFLIIMRLRLAYARDAWGRLTDRSAVEMPIECMDEAAWSKYSIFSIMNNKIYFYSDQCYFFWWWGWCFLPCTRSWYCFCYLLLAFTFGLPTTMNPSSISCRTYSFLNYLAYGVA